MLGEALGEEVMERAVKRSGTVLEEAEANVIRRRGLGGIEGVECLESAKFSDVQ